MKRAALYARYSTDRQSETSIDAQERLCRSRADALGFSIVARHADQAISGSTPVEMRPGGRALVADALAGRFEALILEGLDRLSRDIGEQDRIVKRLEYRGVRIIGVADGYDTQAAGRKVMRVARGLVNELYVDDLRMKVHRSLSAKAARGRHVAGLSYGYRSEADGPDRRLVIVPEQADVVQEIFARYSAGESCQRIAADLNARGVTGPRGGTWSVSALYGSPAKGAGILNNRLYVGEMVWNRSQWIKDPDTGKRTRIDRPRREWQSTAVAELRIVDEDAWSAVRARFDRPKRGHQGGHPRTLFGGFLRCGVCGGAMVAVDGYQYGCAARKDRGPTVCRGTLAPRRATDARLLAVLRDDLAEGTAIAQVREEAARLTATSDGVERARAARLAAVQRKVERLTDAVAEMGLSVSLRARLEAAEAELSALDREAKRPVPSVDDIVTRYRANLLRLTEALQADAERARAALKEMLGSIRVEHRPDGVYALLEMQPAALMLAAGSQMGLVAGEGFEPSTFGL